MRTWVERDGVRLAVRSFGGEGPPVVLLHGLAGTSEEWADVAARIGGCRVLGIDARGHGWSTRHPADVGPSAHAEDVCAVLETLAEPAVLVGQSLGGRTAVLAAARRPELVRAVVVLETSLQAGDDDAEVEDLRAGLRAWPLPFADEAAAHAFFAARCGSQAAARAWTAGLERVAGGLSVRFDPDVMADTLRAAFACSLTAEWDALRCAKTICSAAELGGSMHDVHLERPDEVAAVVRRIAA